MRVNRSFLLSMAIFAFTSQLTVNAHPRLAGVFGDNMVLQREMAVPVWGKENAGETVTVSFNGQTKKTVADDNGAWSVRLDAMAAGGPFEMTVVGASTLVVTNVLVGDVWLCSGQSNMAMVLRKADNAEQEIAAADYPAIRYLTQLYKSRQTPTDSLAYDSRPWQICTPEAARNFSAVAYFFGRALHKELGVPVGLLRACIGGTPIQLWISRDCMEKEPVAKEILDRFDAACADPELPAALETFRQNDTKMRTYMQQTPASEPGPWVQPAFDDSAWDTMDTTQPRGEGYSCALLELRRPVDIPSSWSGKELVLSLYFYKPEGNATAVYFNGERLARQKGLDRHWVRYGIPADEVQAGNAVLALRNFVRWYGSRWQDSFGASELGPRDSEGGLSLSGRWKIRVEDQFDYPNEPLHAGNGRRAPTGLFNGMIHPFVPFGIKGVIWYQGEANAGNGYQYRTLMPLLIQCWREIWGQGDFPFLITQLANFKAPPSVPYESHWAELREAQAMTAQSTPNCGLAVAIDVGDADDIHPKNKQDVGARLALAARKIAYGQDIVYSGPTYRSMEVEDGRIRLTFDHIGSGLVAKGGAELKTFAIAGADRTFVWAEARIDGDDVVVWSDDVKQPVAVRYAWASNPEGCNLYNKEGLPAVPFRTDDFVAAGRPQ